MPSRRLCSEEQAVQRGYGGAHFIRRRAVLRETIKAFEQAVPLDRYHRLAASNLVRWHAESKNYRSVSQVSVFAGDWGEVTHALTKAYGTCFAVLNMANPHVPGGAYVEGSPAQEENMFRRTDCHFRLGPQEFDETSERYHPGMTRLLCADDGRVHLDTHNPRVCIRAAEDRSSADLGYAWLPEEEVFPFFELRAAAQDLRNGIPFDVEDARRRIAGQLETLRASGLRHAVLSAFGCGAFRNPAEQVVQGRACGARAAFRRRCLRDLRSGLWA